MKMITKFLVNSLKDIYHQTDFFIFFYNLCKSV